VCEGRGWRSQNQAFDEFREKKILVEGEGDVLILGMCLGRKRLRVGDEIGALGFGEAHGMVCRGKEGSYRWTDEANPRGKGGSLRTWEKRCLCQCLYWRGLTESD